MNLHFFFEFGQFVQRNRIFSFASRSYKRNRVFFVFWSDCSGVRKFHVDFALKISKLKSTRKKMTIEIKEDNRQTYSFQIDSESLVRIILFLSFHSNYSKSFRSYSCRHIRKKTLPLFFFSERISESSWIEINYFCGFSSVKFLI